MTPRRLMLLATLAGCALVAAPVIRARLFQSDEDGREWGLHWTRPKKRDEQD